MHVIALGWGYVVLMMVLAEALGPDGSVLGAIVTALLYGVLPLGIVLYIGGARASTPPGAPRGGAGFRCSRSRPRRPGAR